MILFSSGVIIGISLFVAAFLVFFIVGSIITNKNKKEVKNKVINIFNNYGETLINNKDFLFKYKKRTYEVYFQNVNLKKEISINNEKTWQIYGSPNILLNMDRLAENNKPKIVIIYPTEEKIKRYINENTVEFVGFQMSYTYYAILLKDLDEFLKSL